MSKNILYLGSKSKAREMLIAGSDISYEILQHDSDECGVDSKLDFEEYVQKIANEKMKHLLIPDKLKTEKHVFLLTADTLVKTLKTRQVLGKPKDLQDAKRMHKILREEPVEVVTGCCLEKKTFENGEWKTLEKKHFTTKTIVEFCVDEEYEDLYFKKMPYALNACVAGIVEGYGQNFLKRVYGSYTSVLGLPIYEVRQVLKEMGFFS
jgi:septum formation protein